MNVFLELHAHFINGWALFKAHNEPILIHDKFLIKL